MCKARLLAHKNFHIALASLSPVVVSSLHIGGDGKWMDFIASTEVGAHAQCPLFLVAVRVRASTRWLPFGGIEGDHKI